MEVSMAKLRWTVTVVCCLSIIACVGRPSAPTQFYMRNPVSPTTDAQPRVMEPEIVLVSLDPVEIPQYLNRPQIITQVDGAEYHLDEFNQWLEPLADTLTRVIAENLVAMLDDHRIEVISMERPVETDFSVTVQILQLDGNPGKEMVLITRWSLFDQSDNVLSLTKRAVFKDTVGDDGYQSIIKAQNRLVESLSREIADAIRPIILPSGS
jgi:hypothetical protein